MNRREFLKNSAILSALAGLGIKPEAVLAADGDILKVRSEFDIQVLDPGYMIGGTDTTLILACMPRLAVPVQGADGTWGWEPSACVESITQDDPTHISFKLKPGLMWSNGQGDVTAEDVKFSFERMLASNWAPRWPTLDRVDVVDTYSGVIVLKSPFVATFLLAIAAEPGAILPKAAVEALPDAKFTTEYPAQFGPYTMTEWLPKQRIVLKANPAWPGEVPAFAEIHIINIEDTNAAELAFQAGEVDVTSVGPDTAARYRNQVPEGAALISQAGPLYSWIGLNTEHPTLSDLRVRQAIQRAIDVPTILQAAYGGAAIAHGIVPPGLVGNRNVSGYNYDPDGARALLTEAGVSDLKITFKMLNEPYLLTAAQIVQANLADVGITCELAPVDSGVFWNLGVEAAGEDWRDLQMWMMRFRTAPDASDTVQWFVKSQVGIWNWERWSDPEFEDLAVKMLSEADPETRGKQIVRMQEIMENTGAYVWLTHDLLNFVHRTSVTPAFDTGSEYMVQRFDLA